jgi:hypothetical protein
MVTDGYFMEIQTEVKAGNDNISFLPLRPRYIYLGFLIQKAKESKK